MTNADFSHSATKARLEGLKQMNIHSANQEFRVEGNDGHFITHTAATATAYYAFKMSNTFLKEFGM